MSKGRKRKNKVGALAKTGVHGQGQNQKSLNFALQ